MQEGNSVEMCCWWGGSALRWEHNKVGRRFLQLGRGECNVEFAKQRNIVLIAEKKQYAAGGG